MNFTPASSSKSHRHAYSQNITPSPFAPGPAVIIAGPVIKVDPSEKDTNWYGVWDFHGGESKMQEVIANLCDKDLRDHSAKAERCKFNCGSKYHICFDFCKHNCNEFVPIHKHPHHDHVPDGFDGDFVHIPPRCKFEFRFLDGTSGAGCSNFPGECRYVHHEGLVRLMNVRIKEMALSLRAVNKFLNNS